MTDPNPPISTPSLGMFGRVLTWVTSPTGVLCAFAIGLIGTIFGVYAFFYQEAKHAELSMAIYRADPVLSEFARVAGVKLQIGNEVLDPVSSTARVVLVRVWNSGDLTVKSDDIDKSEPFGFQLTGSVMRVDVLQASTPYLKRSMAPTLSEAGTVTLGPATLEPGEAVLLRAFVRRSDAEAEEIEPLGKIAGMPQITKRLTEWHPGDYVQGYPTPAQHRLKMIFKGSILSLLFLLIGYVAFLKVREWKASRA